MPWQSLLSLYVFPGARGFCLARVIMLHVHEGASGAGFLVRTVIMPQKCIRMRQTRISMHGNLPARISVHLVPDQCLAQYHNSISEISGQYGGGGRK